MGEGNKPKIALDSLGCKLNQAEIELLARQFADAGYRLVSADDNADVYILNTCTVTHMADSKSRHRLRMVHRHHPDAVLVAIGCYAQRAPEDLAQIEGVGLVVGNEEKPLLLRLLGEAGYLIGAVKQGSSTDHYPGLRTRALVKVQDGCDRFCAYCIVPLVRGGEKSLPADDVVAEVRHLEAQGYREVVITGVEIGSYKYDGVGLKGLLEHVLDYTEVDRLRISSLQPPEIPPELVALWHNPRLCPHFHLSLQSGSDGVLHRMKRLYSTADYEQVVSLIRGMVPGVAITTDVMVGFPGETDAEFEESYRFCQEIGFARIHVFSFSLRDGTEAARMPNQVSDKVKKERSQRMLALAEGSARKFHERFLSEKLAVLFEQQYNGIWSGLTGNYIRVYTKSREDLTNKLLPAKLEKIYKDGVWGETV